MTLAMGAKPRTADARAQAPTHVRRFSLQGWDVLALAGLVAMWAAVLAFRYDALPMQLWDESRNANNALEMAQSGHWLTPTYAGVVDHWNTKPPLMIWGMAALLKLGLPPLLALRAPAMLAALATALTLWGVLRFALRDRLGAWVAALLLLSAPLYIGAHGARTADYDAPESLFILGYVLSVWAAFEGRRARWLLVATLCMTLGVLTKGVAALLAMPGLALFALCRPSRCLHLLRRWETWAAALGFVTLAAGYYLSREGYDHGYLAAVASNELGGRFLRVTDNHRGGWSYYLSILEQAGGPGVPVTALSLFSLIGGDGRRRSLALAALLSAASLLLVLSGAKSKLAWYAVPLEPLLCLIAGLGVTDALRRLTEGGAGPARRAAVPAIIFRAALALTLAAAVVIAIAGAQNLPARAAAAAGAAQYRYGPFLAEVRRAAPAQALVVVDGGFYNDAGFSAYDPMLKFYLGLDQTGGPPPSVRPNDQDLDAGVMVASCDPKALHALADDYRLQPILRQDGCLLAKVLGDAP